MSATVRKPCGRLDQKPTADDLILAPLPLPLSPAVFKRQMEACFFHTLSELDPQYSTHLASRPRIHKATMAERLLKQFGITGEEAEDVRLVRCS